MRSMLVTKRPCTKSVERWDLLVGSGELISLLLHWARHCAGGDANAAGERSRSAYTGVAGVIFEVASKDECWW